MAKKKTSKKTATLSPLLFKITGAHAKMKVDDKKKKLYYFSAKITPEKAAKSAETDGADILGGTPTDIGKPALKYDFYCTYAAALNLKFLRVRPQELGVNDQVVGALVGKDVLIPKKGKDIPGKSVKIDMIELFEINQSENVTIDGMTGAPAKSLESLLKGLGKKTASPAWVKKNPTTTGPYSSLEKVVRQVTKMASTRPSDAKRVTTHELTFKQLDGYYVPTYYVNISKGEQKKTMKINALNGMVSVKV